MANCGHQKFSCTIKCKKACFRHFCVQKEPHSGHQKGTYVYNISGFVLTNYIFERKSTQPRLQEIYGFTFVAQVSKCSTKFLAAFSSPLCNKKEKIGVSSQTLPLNEYSKHMVLSTSILR